MSLKWLWSSSVTKDATPNNFPNKLTLDYSSHSLFPWHITTCGVIQHSNLWLRPQSRQAMDPTSNAEDATHSPTVHWSPDDQTIADIAKCWWSSGKGQWYLIFSCFPKWNCAKGSQHETIRESRPPDYLIWF